MKAISAYIGLLVSAELALGQFYTRPSYMTTYSAGSPYNTGYAPYGQPLYQRSAFMPVTSYASSSSSRFPQVRSTSWSEPPPPPPPQQQQDNWSWPSNGLPPASSVTEDQLFGGIDVSGLIKPYSSGDNSEINEKPVQLPTLVEWQQGPSREYDHTYPTVYKQQEVVSNKLINTFTNQLKQININQKEIHRDHKAIDVLTKYILNIARVNHPSLEKQTLTKIGETHQPILYVIHKKKDIINDSKPVQAALVVSESAKVERLPPSILPPVIKKYGYENQPVWSTSWPEQGERRSF